MDSKPANEQDNTPSVERIIEVYPPDYVTLKKQVQTDSEKISDLQNRCRSLEHMLAFRDISPIDHIIHDYKSMSDFYLAQLSKEIAIYRFSEDERIKLLDFVNYLRSITNDIENMLLVNNERS